MTYQRKRGIPVKIYKVKLVQDARGNDVKVADLLDFHELKAWQIPDRSAKAEVDGQQKINVVRIGTKDDLSGVELWSQVDALGKRWDVVTPPAFHRGSSRSTRHWTIGMRERP